MSGLPPVVNHTSSVSTPYPMYALLPQVTVSDTVGCGDSFASAIILGYIDKHDIASTLMLANAVGAATAMGRGAGTNVATAECVRQLLQSSLHKGAHAPQHVQHALTMLESSLSKPKLKSGQPV